MTRWTEADFDRLSWHDNALHGLQWRPEDPESGEWRSDFVLDFDYIAGWVPGPDGRMRFRVAPVPLA